MLDPCGTHPLSNTIPLTRACDVELRAASYYSQGFHCGESVLKSVLEVTGSELPADVVRLSSGFCEGLGGSRCICGALAGGIMALGLMLGRRDSRDPWEPAYYAAAELRGRWVEDQEAESCEEVVGRIGGMELPSRWAHCTELVGRTARWVVEIAEAQRMSVEGAEVSAAVASARA